MSVKMIADAYKNGKITNRQAALELQKGLETLFEISSMMAELNMSWRLGEEGEVTASLGVTIPHAEKLTEVKLHISDTDMTQIPYGYLLSGHLTELEDLKVFFGLLNGGTLIDIGANVGWYSILAGLAGGRVYAFEPIQETYQVLCRNIALNGLTNVKPYHTGLGEKTGTDLFYYNPNVSGASSRVDLDFFSDGSAQKIECPMDTLDHVRAQEQIEKIDLIKCDVEGGELFVYRGGRETIRRFRPFVLSEMLRKWSAKFHYHPDEIIKLFADLDYICVALSKKEPGTGYILEHMLDTTEETNFLFVPAEKVKQVRKILSF